MRDVLLAAHISGAVVAVLAAIGQFAAAGRLRAAATPAGLLRWNRLLATIAIVFTLVVILVPGAGFALLGGLWSVSDPWVASALVQVLAVLLATVTVVIPATQRITDHAATDSGAAHKVAADPLLRAVLATQPLLLVGIVVLMFNKPPLAGSIEIPGLVVVAGLANWAVRAARKNRPIGGVLRRTVTWAVAAVVAVAAVAGYAQWRAAASRLPARISMNQAMGNMAGMGQGTSLTSLSAPGTGVPVREYTLTAEPEQLTVAGRMLSTWRLRTGQGGSEIRVPQGTEVISHLVNHLPVSTSVHWHGVDVPASQDGVSGVTQDAVPPGGSFTYRFVANRAGTYWYHAHQDSVHQVQAGLFGALVVTPPGGVGAEVDQTVEIHTWKDGPTTLEGAVPAATAGRNLRLRVINTDSLPRVVTLVGAPFRVAAIDGYEIPGAAPLTGTALTIPAGGRYDLTFQSSAAGTAWLETLNGVGKANLSTGVPGPAPAPGRLADFDLTRYGTHSAGGLTATQRFNRDYTVRLDAGYGWYDGSFGQHYTMNGALFPNGPMLTVAYGDLVKITIINRTHVDHPMHLHGHHFTLLARNGKPLTGAPMVLDTLNVAPFETWTVAFRADNPGLWMFHCHNLSHASEGMDMMVAYEGVTTPYFIGTKTGNHPE